MMCPICYGRFRVEINKFKACILLISKAQAGIHAHADVFRRFMDGKAVDLAIFVIALTVPS